MTSIASTDRRSRIREIAGTQIIDGVTITRMLALGLTCLILVLGTVTTPAPAIADILMLGLIVLLPMAGLIAVEPALILLLCVWLIAGASALIAASQAADLSGAVVHSSVSIYFYIAFAVLAAFIAKRPEAHTRLIMQAYVCAAVLVSMILALGYVELIPGAGHQFANFNRASDGLTNSSLLSSFLVPPLLYALHLMISRPLASAALPAGLFVLMGYATLIGVWSNAGMNLAVAGTTYVFFAFATSPTQLQRLKLLLIGAVCSVALASALVVSAQQPQTSQALAECSMAAQVSNVEVAKRLDGYNQAAAKIALNPLGIGVGGSGERHDSARPGNVYLNMMLQSGWLGGLIFIAITLLTVAAGFAHAIKPSRLQPMIIIAYSAFLGLAAQGLTADLEHWRHYYLILAILWGLIASNGSNFAFHHQAMDKEHIAPADDQITATQERIPTIIGPGRSKLAARKPEERRDRSHHPRRPQSMAYT